MRRGETDHGQRLEGRNLVLEALRGRQRLSSLLMDERARSCEKLEEIVRLAEREGVPLKRVPRDQLDRMSVTGGHNGVIAESGPLEAVPLASVLARLRREPERSHLLVAFTGDEAPDDLGAALRTADAVGVDAVLLGPRSGGAADLESALLPPSARRVSMGAAEHLQFVRTPLPPALLAAREAGIRTVAVVQGDGHPSLHDAPLTGPLLLLFGAGTRPLPFEVARQLDMVVALRPVGAGALVPLSAVVAVALYERVRQSSS